MQRCFQQFDRTGFVPTLGILRRDKNERKVGLGNEVAI